MNGMLLIYFNALYGMRTELVVLRLYMVMFEYSKFRIESSSYFSIRFDSKRVQIFEIFEYLLSPISYLFKQNDADFSP